MIQNLSIRNFKVLRQADIELKALTVIVGPNSSGKSTVLHALKHLTRFGEILTSTDEVPLAFRIATLEDKDGFQERGALDSLRRKGCDGSTILKAWGRRQGKGFNLELEVREGGRYRYVAELDGHKIPAPLAPTFLNMKSVLLKLDVNKLGAPSYPKQTSLTLPDDGDGLSSVLAGIHLEDISRFKRIIEQTRSVIGGLQDIHIKQVPMERALAFQGPNIGYQLFFDMKGAKGIPAHNISDGTLLTLALLVSLSVPVPPDLVMIDDVERGFHPRALQDLVRQLRNVQDQEPELQIVVTSHSPYLLDFLRAEEILLASLDDDGYSTVQPLVRHPDYERWKGFMAPGEFWSSVGEDWITKDKKVTAR